MPSGSCAIFVNIAFWASALFAASAVAEEDTMGIAVVATECNDTEDVAVMLTLKSFTTQGVHGEAEQATAEMMDTVSSMVSTDRQKINQLLQPVAPFEKDVAASELLQQKNIAANVTYADLGNGYCRPKTNYYGQYGMSSASCKSHCDLEEVCIAYSFRTDDGACGIWAPTVTAAPTGWTFWAGEGATEITHTNSVTDAYCMKKQVFRGTATVLFNATTQGPKVSFTQGVVFGGVAVVFILLIVACLCWKIAILFKSTTQKDHPFEGRPVEVWERTVVDQHEYLESIFHRLDQMEQSDESPPGYITLQDLRRAMLIDKPMKNYLQGIGITFNECSAVFAQLDKNHTGLVAIDEFIEGLDHLSSRATAHSARSNR